MTIDEVKKLRAAARPRSPANWTSTRRASIGPEGTEEVDGMMEPEDIKRAKRKRKPRTPEQKEARRAARERQRAEEHEFYRRFGGGPVGWAIGSRPFGAPAARPATPEKPSPPGEAGKHGA